MSVLLCCEDAAASGGVKLSESLKYAKYFKMLKMRIPPGAVKNKMKQDGLDPSILDLGGDAMEPSAASSAAPKTTGVKLADSKKYGKYFKMLKMGIPPGAVKNKMTQDGVDPAQLDRGGDAMELTPPGTQGRRLSLPFTKLTDSPASGGRKKKKKPKKPTDGLVRKKIHWRKIGTSRLTASMWGTGEVSSKDFKLDAREEREMKALFCQSMFPDAEGGDGGFGSVSPGREGVLSSGVSKVSKGGQKGGAGRRGSMKSKKAKAATLLDMTRANNISIVLARFDSGSVLEQLTRAVCSLSTMGMQPEHLRSLLSLAPTTTEADMLRKYEGKCTADALGKAERFCMALIRIPRYTERIRCFMYVLRFEEIVKDLEQDLEKLKQACTRVFDSKALKRALVLLLAIGNYLNLHSVNGEAEGVTVDSLNKLKRVKSYGSQTTALHYFTLVAQSRCSEVFQLSQEVGDCRGAASVVLSSLKAEIKMLRKGFARLAQAKTTATKDIAEKSKGGDGKDRKPAEIVPGSWEDRMQAISTLDADTMNELFVKAIDTFMEGASQRLDAIDGAEGDVTTKFDAVRKHYGEFDATPPEQFFTCLADFLVDFEQSRRDNEDSRNKAKKRKIMKAKQEAQARKLELRRQARKKVNEKKNGSGGGGESKSGGDFLSENAAVSPGGRKRPPPRKRPSMIEGMRSQSAPGGIMGI